MNIGRFVHRLIDKYTGTYIHWLTDEHIVLYRNPDFFLRARCVAHFTKISKRHRHHPPHCHRLHPRPTFGLPTRPHAVLSVVSPTPPTWAPHWRWLCMKLIFINQFNHCYVKPLGALLPHFSRFRSFVGHYKCSVVTPRVSNPYDYVNHIFKRP
jgi:hypothetical protein